MKNIIITILVFIVLALVLVLTGVIKLNINLQFDNGGSADNVVNTGDILDTEKGVQNSQDKDKNIENQTEGQGQKTESNEQKQNENQETGSNGNNSNQNSEDATSLNVNMNNSVSSGFVLQVSSDIYSSTDTQNNESQEQPTAEESLSSVFDKADFSCKLPIVEAYTLRGYSHDYSWYGAQDVNVNVETVYAPEVYKNWSACKKDPLAWINNKTARILKITNNEKRKTVRIKFSELKEIKMSPLHFFDIYDTEGRKVENYVLGPKDTFYFIPKNILSISGAKEGPHMINIFIGSDYIKGKQIKFAFPVNEDKTRIVHIDSKLPCVKDGQAGTWRYKYEISADPGQDIYTSKVRTLRKYCK